MSNPYYREYSDFLSELFPGGKVQKLSVNAGFGCPNRDGTKGRGGCSYCNNRSFSPAYTGVTPGDVSRQMEQGRQFFSRKYPDMRYLAYFQSYTGTYAGIGRLLPLYEAALDGDDVVGLVIGTRPDCMPDALLEALVAINCRKPVIVEYGVESAHDITLCRVNRCHTWADSADAVTRTLHAGLHVGVHLIMGLPGEDRRMMLDTVDRVAALSPHTLKLHQLQVLRGTRLAQEDVPVFQLDDYLDLCVDIVLRLRDTRIAFDRFTASSPADMLLAPRWGLKNHEFVALLHKRLGECTKIFRSLQG